MTLIVKTPKLRVELDSRTGGIVSVHNERRGLELIRSRPSDAPPFRLRYTDGTWRQHHDDSFSYTTIADGFQLRWEGSDGVLVTGTITTVGTAVAFDVRVAAAGDVGFDVIEYPIIAGIERLGGRTQDKLLHSHGTGIVFDDPLDLFEDDDDQDTRHMRYSPYPDGFHGSTLQMLAYYAQDLGGFLLHTPDPDRLTKWFAFHKKQGALEAAALHDLASSESGVVPYPTVLTPLTDGTWYEAADIYREWAGNQSWARRRSDRAHWLRREVGLATFGINASHDRSAWLDLYHRVADTPVFHILGANWPRYGQDYHNTHPRGRADWFPTRLSSANLATIRANGDYWAPFEFDLLADRGGPEDAEVLAGRLGQNLGTLRPATYVRPYMCAGSEYFRDLHRWRDTTLVEEHDTDALYYDISVSNLLLDCDARDHDHKPGGGKDVAECFRGMYRSTSAAASAAKGKHVPMGTEVINEAVVELFDYYQARAQSTPIGPFEMDYFRDWIVAGHAEHVPLFRYVFGAAAPIAVDGWSNLAAETGELADWVAAKVLTNGGLLELNYEFAGLEDLDGHTDDPSEHYWDYPRRGFRVSDERAAFLRRIAQVRTGSVGAWLSDGEMLPAPTIEAPMVELDYFRYNTFRDDGYEERGSMTVPAVVGTAWRLDGAVIWLLANPTRSTVDARVDGRQVTIPAKEIIVVEL